MTNIVSNFENHGACGWFYAKGLAAEICRKNKWQFMIVLKDGALPSVIKEFEALSTPEEEKLLRHTRANRKQIFRWVNGIDYRFESNDGN